MDVLNSILTGIPVFIILLGPLMFVHELGHFLAAKRAGIRVEEFGMGFPPRALTLFKRGETVYSLNWLPIGAFVRMTGEEDPTDPHSFAAQPKRWRFITLVAGPGMNFIAAIVILFLAYLLFATQVTEGQYRIDSVNPGSPAAKLGFMPGDIVLAANGQDMTQHIDSNSAQQASVIPLKQASQAAIGKPFNVEVMRKDAAGVSHEVALDGSIPADANPETPLGVSLSLIAIKAERIPYTFDQAFVAASTDAATVMDSMVRVPVELIRGTLSLSQARPTGIVGITGIGVELIRENDVQGLFPFIRFAGLLSLILGITNLLPIPALDGGRIVFVLIEWVRGRRIDPLREQWVHGIGIIILLALSAVIAVFDIINPISLR
ncbi:MAG: site-2 protease family protein [Chloroflexi bacterium]|nr:site-2 protease family protein [Chloroflexota bacterium]MCL5275811.1 site-2 protease family protein [Chloroflexota bacterium]